MDDRSKAICYDQGSFVDLMGAPSYSHNNSAVDEELLLTFLWLAIGLHHTPDADYSNSIQLTHTGFAIDLVILRCFDDMHRRKSDVISAIYEVNPALYIPLTSLLNRTLNYPTLPSIYSSSLDLILAFFRHSSFELRTIKVTN